MRSANFTTPVHLEQSQTHSASEKTRVSDLTEGFQFLSRRVRYKWHPRFGYMPRTEIPTSKRADLRYMVKQMTSGANTHWSLSELLQSRFDQFRYVFNNERPHEGLNNPVPASVCIPSSVRMPRKLPEFKYPKGLLLRRVNSSGDISWHRNRVFISEVFCYEKLRCELAQPGLSGSCSGIWRSENSKRKTSRHVCSARGFRSLCLHA